MDWLEERTGLTAFYWMQRVQTLITENSTEAAEDTAFSESGELKSVAGHGSTDLVWLSKLMAEVLKTAPVSGPVTGVPAYDENMRAASILSAILALWYASVQQAKCFDPARPSNVRRGAYKNFRRWVVFMLSNMTSLEFLSSYFPDQKWGNPFHTGSDEGSFI